MIRISLIQTALCWEDPAMNYQMLEPLVLSQAGKADIIVLPEMFATGFTMNASNNAQDMNGAGVQWLRRMSGITSAVITGSLIISDNGKYYNRLIWMQPDGEMQHYDKRHLFSLAGEEKVFTRGNERKVFEWKGWRIFPLICYDLRFPVWSRRTKSFDFDLLLYVANWPERRSNAWKKLLPARAIENQCYVAAVNRIGHDGNQIFHTGDSAILDYTGEAIASASSGETVIINAALEKSKLYEFRNQFAFGQDADEFNFVER